jgi:hypothetical protein
MVKTRFSFPQTFPQQDFLGSLLNKNIRLEIRGVLLITMFILWRERYSRIFNDKEKIMTQLTEEVYQQWKILR